ncbi:MAG: LysM peptidoglycan-binding domain-containing protein [Spirochaetes bacterium]|nr:LysM peptidoglycan-binding domain-containing protein [Spirochaetota bacterium]
MATINNEERKNNTILIVLIFFLVFLIISSIIIFSRFSISSKRAGTEIEKSNEIKISKIEEEAKQEKKETAQKQETQVTPVVPVTPQVQQKPQTQPQVQTKPSTQPSTQQQTTVKPSKPKTTVKTSKETKPSNYYINAKNIKKFHSILLKEFEGVKTVDYKVVWGDTLWKIALRYNTSAHTIYVLNAFDDPDLIICGSIIKVPVNFVLSKTRTNSILTELIQKEKTGFNNKNNVIFNKNYSYNCINIENEDNVLDYENNKKNFEFTKYFKYEYLFHLI